MIHGDSLYWTLDWINSPLLALAFTIFTFVLEVMCFTFLYFVTKAKLRKYIARENAQSHKHHKHDEIEEYSTALNMEETMDDSDLINQEDPLVSA